jgi:hypothetical protein
MELLKNWGWPNSQGPSHGGSTSSKCDVQQKLKETERTLKQLLNLRIFINKVIEKASFKKTQEPDSVWQKVYALCKLLAKKLLLG